MRLSERIRHRGPQRDEAGARPGAAVLFLLGAALLLGSPAQAQSGAAGPAGPVAPTLQGDLALSLADAIAMGIENNLDVEIVRHDPLIADYQATSAWGVYDPEFFADFEYASDENPVASSLQSATSVSERRVGGNGGVRGLLPKLGWSYQVGYTGQSLESTSSIQSLSPEYRTTVLATATLPILRGFLWGDGWTQVKLSDVQSETAYETFRRQLMDVVKAIEDAYWNLAARRDQLRVAETSVETASELLEQTEAQYEVGVVSRVEVVEAEAGIAAREVDLIRARNELGRGQDELVNLVLGPFLQPGSKLRIVTTDDPQDYRTFAVDAEEAGARAFAHRPELEIARQAVEQREIRLKFARNSRLPQLDLRGSWGQNGLSGATSTSPDLFGGQRAPITSVGRDYFDADNEFFGAKQAKSWSAGALLSIPIGNIRGRADVGAAKLELRRSLTELRREEQRIVLEVRNAIRDLETGLEGIGAAEARRRAAEEQLRAEQIRLEHGESTPFDVLQRQEQLVDAESQKIGALQIYHSSVAALDRAQGTILRDRNVVVDEAAQLR